MRSATTPHPIPLAGRTAHYGDFYRPSGSGPVAVVHGNCQAEAVRVVLGCSPTFPLPLVRVPPVHELERSDLPHLRRLWRRCRLLLAQPVRAGYRDLPIGTSDVAAELPSGATVLRWPVLRYAGLHPWCAIVRHPVDVSLEPPIVPYHDLRTVAAAAGRRPRRVGGGAFRSVARASLDELRRREAGLDVSAADELDRLGAAATHVVNHPANAVIIAVARGLQRAAGLPEDAADPGRVLLGRLRAPIEEPVLDALGLAAAPREHWLVDGEEVTCEEIADAHRRWYDGEPACVDAALERHGALMTTLGL